jgi:multisubunit Na+/H+ antiporter MnhE subunit
MTQTDIWNTALLCIYLRNQKSQYTEWVFSFVHSITISPLISSHLSTQNAMHRIMLWTIGADYNHSELTVTNATVTQRRVS